jgi:DNA-binding NarL/FixJ family response regulator
VSALAVLGQECALRTAAAVAGVEGALTAAEELARHGLADLVDTELGTTLAFRHGLVRASVLDDLSLSDRTRLHDRASRELSGPEAVRHRLAAADAPSPELVASARDAADTLVARGALTPAARLLTGAARLLVGGPEREDLVLSAATLLLDAGAPVDALAPEIEQYDASASRDFVLGRLAFGAGDVVAAVELLSRAWSSAPPDSALAATAADWLAMAATALGRFDELARWSRRAVATGDGSLNSPVMLFYGVALDSSPATAEQELTALVDARRGTAVELGARLARGMCRLARNDLEGAEPDLAAAGLAPQVQGSVQAFVNARAFLAECHFRLGDWRRAHDLAVSTTSIVDDAGAVWMSALPHNVAATVLAATGELDAARAHAAVARSTAESLGMVQAIVWARVAELRVAEAAGEATEVVRIGDDLLAAGIADLPDWVQRRRPAYVEALAALGRTADAERQLAELEAEVADSGDTSLAAEAARARSTVLLAADHRVAAGHALDAGLALDPVRSRPFERARLELAAGALRRRAGERRTAAELLESAAQRLRALGARPWLERCERELAACGLQPAKRSAPSQDPVLTPQERLVASLATSGLTNREIASELVLSAKTVEFHLSRIYRKLGVRSRSQLAARLAADQD